MNGPHSGVMIYGKGAGHAEWIDRGRGNYTPYVDGRPPVTAGTSETRQYRMRYLDKYNEAAEAPRSRSQGLIGKARHDGREKEPSSPGAEGEPEFNAKTQRRREPGELRHAKSVTLKGMGVRGCLGTDYRGQRRAEEARGRHRIFGFLCPLRPLWFLSGLF